VPEARQAAEQTSRRKAAFNPRVKYYFIQRLTATGFVSPAHLPQEVFRQGHRKRASPRGNAVRAAPSCPYFLL